MKLVRTVIAQPTCAAAHPGAAFPDINVEGADLALAFLDDNETTAILLTADGAANVAELILRTLTQHGHTDEATRAIQQAWLEVQGGNPAAVLATPKNTIEKAIFLPGKGT